MYILIHSCFGARCRWVVNIMHRPINPQWKILQYALIKKQKESHLWCGLFGEEKNLLPPAGFELSTNRITTAAYRFLRHGIDQPDAYRLTIDLTRWRYHWLFDIQVSSSIYNSSNKHRLTGVHVRIRFMFYILCVTSIRIWNMRTYTPLCKNSCSVSVQTKILPLGTLHYAVKDAGYV